MAHGVSMRWSHIFLMAAVSLGGCTSPEATRTRGGDRGADVDNRTQVVQMHEGSHPYWETPRLIESESEHPSLASARHAAELSRK